MFSGTVVFGKIIKFDKGKIGILFGNLKSFFISLNSILIKYIIIPILYYGLKNWQAICKKEKLTYG